jgi:putative transposase
MARENSGWGYDRIVGALANLGHRVSDQTVGNVLRRYGIPPAPKRSQKTTWKEFISAHLAVLTGVDFFSAPHGRRSPVGEGPTQVVVGRT